MTSTSVVWRFVDVMIYVLNVITWKEVDHAFHRVPVSFILARSAVVQLIILAKVRPLRPSEKPSPGRGAQPSISSQSLLV